MIKMLAFPIVRIAMAVIIMSAASGVASAYSAIGWGIPALHCQVVAATTAHPPVYDATYGEIYFAPGDTGSYHLICPVQSFGNGIFAGTFGIQGTWITYNDDAANGCSITGVGRYHDLSDSGAGTWAVGTSDGPAYPDPWAPGLAGSDGQFQFKRTTFLNANNPPFQGTARWWDITVTRTTPNAQYCGVDSLSSDVAPE
jgi:hypothetical protein